MTSASGDAMDGGVWILIDGSSGDARSRRNRKFIIGQDRNERSGESRIRITEPTSGDNNRRKPEVSCGES
jgi:hypothetical protein